MVSAFYIVHAALQPQPYCGSLLGKGITGTTHQQSQKTKFYWALSFFNSMPCFSSEYGLDSPSPFRQSVYIRLLDMPLNHCRDRRSGAIGPTGPVIH